MGIGSAVVMGFVYPATRRVVREEVRKLARAEGVVKLSEREEEPMIIISTIFHLSLGVLLGEEGDVSEVAQSMISWIWGLAAGMPSSGM